MIEERRETKGEEERQRGVGERVQAIAAVSQHHGKGKKRNLQ